MIDFCNPVVCPITVGSTPPKDGTPGFRSEKERGPSDVLNSPLPGEWALVPLDDSDHVFE